MDPETLRAKVAVDGLSGQWAMNVGFGSAWLSRSVDDHGWIERYDLETGELEAKIDVGKAPVETLSALGHVWVPDHHGGTVYRIDPKTNTVDGSIAVDLDPIEIAAGGGRIWVVGPHARRLAAIDAKTLEVTLETSFPELVCGVAYLGGRAWVRSCTGPKVYVIDASTGAEIADVKSLTPVKDGDRAWAPFPEDNDRFLVGRLDPQSAEIHDRVRIVGLPLSHAVGHGSLWTTSGTTLYGWALDDLP